MFSRAFGSEEGTSSGLSAERLRALVEQKYAASAPVPSLDLRSRGLKTADLSQLQSAWPPGMQELLLDNNSILTFSALNLPSCLTILKLPYNRIVRFESWKFPSSLQILELNNNYLSSIPVSCLDLPNLKELNLEFNVLKASNAVDMLLQCASFCTSLQSLCIGANRFEHRDIQSKINETWLSIDALLKENPQVMSAMCYSELELKKMPDKKRLKRGLSACTVVKIFAAAAAEKHQTLLSDSMAAGPGNYKSLLNPDHAVVHVSSLLKTLTESSQPDAFSLLTLNLSGCNLSSSIHPMLIGVLQRLPSLIELDLSLNSLAGDRVTAILSGASTSLQSLKMCNSGISASSFSSARRALNFISLQHLDVSDNMELLSSGFIFLLQSCAAPKLIHLEASNCGIDLRTNEDYLPNVLSFFHRTTSLTHLNLSKNCIGVVVLEKILRHMSPDPQNFGRPSCANSATLLDSSRVVSNSWISPLQILDFSCTACDDCLPNSSQHFDNWLDSVFIHYSNLTRLLLSDNHHIFNIQPGVAHLRRLTFLDLSNCINLLNICEVLFAENEGRNFELKLVGCDALENPPKSVIEKGLVAIRKHISNEKVQQQSVELRHVKAIFLGNDAAARRSLLCSLANFRESDVKSFDEINQLIREQHVAGKSFLSKAFSRDNRPNVSFWNFCGELECCTHFNFFLSAYQSIYIILFNVSDSPDVVVQQLSYWLRAVFDTGGLQHSIRIFLVGTHFDQVPQSRLDSCTYLIDNLLMAMGIFYPFRSQISLKWWSSTNPLKWLGFCQPSDTDATIHSVLDTIFDTSEKILSKGNGTLHFPIMYERMLDEVKRLAQNCQESKSMPLVKLSELTEAQGFRVLAGSHRNLRRLDAVKICSEVGILIHFKDIKDDEDWIGVNLNFCLDVVMYFTNYVMTLKSTSLPLNRCILSKHEMYQIVTNVFQSAAPTVSWYASSLAQSYPESLFGFFVTQTLLLPVDSRHIQLHSGDAYGFMVPMLLKPRPHSWRAIFGHLFSGHLVQDAAVASWGFGMPIRIKASRYTSASQESLITVSKFLKLMLSKCFDYRHMWDASFLYHVEGTSIFVRLAEDRLGVDIVTIGSYAASIPAKVSREIQDIALNLEFRDRQAKRICPRCCVTDQYLKSGLNRVFFEQQLDHYKEYGISGTCYFDHEVEASSLEEGEKLIMPAAPEPEGPFFSGIAISSIDSLRKTVLWLDGDPQGNEQIRRSIPGYVGMKQIQDGSVLLEFDFSSVEPSEQMDVYCFSSVDAIKSFMTRPDNLKYLAYPTSMFRIISNRRLFIGDSGLRAFLDDPRTRWAFSYPSTMIFYGGNPEGLECVRDRPNTVMSTASRDCVAFISFGHMFPSVLGDTFQPPGGGVHVSGGSGASAP